MGAMGGPISHALSGNPRSDWTTTRSGPIAIRDTTHGQNGAPRHDRTRTAPLQAGEHRRQPRLLGLGTHSGTAQHVVGRLHGAARPRRPGGPTAGQGTRTPRRTNRSREDIRAGQPHHEPHGGGQRGRDHLLLARGTPRAHPLPPPRPARPQAHRALDRCGDPRVSVHHPHVGAGPQRVGRRSAQRRGRASLQVRAAPHGHPQAGLDRREDRRPRPDGRDEQTDLADPHRLPPAHPRPPPAPRARPGGRPHGAHAQVAGRRRRRPGRRGRPGQPRGHPRRLPGQGPQGRRGLGQRRDRDHEVRPPRPQLPERGRLRAGGRPHPRPHELRRRPPDRVDQPNARTDFFEIGVLKNRYGPTGQWAPFSYSGSSGRIADVRKTDDGPAY
jgi:hypothetical protein